MINDNFIKLLMRVEKYIQKHSTPAQKIAQPADLKPNPIANNHEYLNFVKKNAKLMYAFHYPAS